MTATPTKLRNGSWGARVEGKPSIGETITIRAKSGKSWQARVSAIVWTDGTASIVATASTDRESRPSSGKRYRGRNGGGSAANVPGYSSYCTGRSGCGCYDCAS